LQQSVLVTGATGAVGLPVVRILVESGYTVRTLSLDAVPKDAWPTGVDVSLGDVTDAETVQQAIQGVNVVIHLAAILHKDNPSPEMRNKYERINVGGTATVVDAAIKAGVKRMVFSSTIAVYGPSFGRVLNEESAATPDTLYSQTKLAAEKIVLTAKRKDGQPLGTVLRFGAVYGARIKGNYQRLVHALSRVQFISIGDGHNRRTLVYERDVARAVMLAMQHPTAAGKIYNVSDGQFHTVTEINDVICETLGHSRLPRLSIPILPARLVAGGLEDVAGLIGLRSPIVRATIDKYIEDVAVDSQRIQTELGFMPLYNLQTGWQETIQELRKSGEL
jgi:nucleoside-diphosphate-sugar epimerase